MNEKPVSNQMAQEPTQKPKAPAIQHAEGQQPVQAAMQIKHLPNLATQAKQQPFPPTQTAKPTQPKQPSQPKQPKQPKQPTQPRQPSQPKQQPQAKQQSQAKQPTHANQQNSQQNQSAEAKPKQNNFFNRSRNSKNKTQNKAPAIPVKIMPLGGLGEVGKNITLYECEGEMIIVDCGLVFPDSDMFGIDLVIPDFSYVIQNKDKIHGVVVTHGHEDHIGALPYLLKEHNFPIYATRLAIGLIGNKLDEHGLKGSAKLIEIQPKQKFKLGKFTIEPIHVNHSIPDAVALAIECPAGVILQTGDFKIDHSPISGGVTDLHTIGDYGKTGVLALLSDSTNSERAGFTVTEQKVGESFANLFEKADKKRIIIATFASNLYRVQQIIDIAVKSGRKVAVSGRSMVKNTQMALELGYLHAPEGVLIDIESLNKYLPEQVVLVTTGSQGEPLSALSRMSSSSHRSVRVGVGDFIIISANPIPGNEKMVTKVINSLLKLGSEVIYESMYDVHVSGHACQEEQKLMISMSRPQFFLPVHGEYKQLKRHAMTAATMGINEKNIIIGENGDCIILSKDGASMGDTVTSGAVMVDGLGVGDVGNVVMRDRKHLSQDGLIIIVATVESSSGEILAGPDLVSRGFVYVRESDELMNECRDVVRVAFNKCRTDNVREWNSVKTRVREAVSTYVYRKTKRSPMILPILMEV